MRVASRDVTVFKNKSSNLPFSSILYFFCEVFTLTLTYKNIYKGKLNYLLKLRRVIDGYR